MDLWSSLQSEMGQGSCAEQRFLAYRLAFDSYICRGAISSLILRTVFPVWLFVIQQLVRSPRSSIQL